MAQQRTWNFGDAFSAKKATDLIFALNEPGRYRGYDVTVVDTDKVQLAAKGYVLLPDGIVVTEDNPVYLILNSLPVVATRYSITIRHTDSPTLGGAAATYALEIGNYAETLADGITIAYIDHPGGAVALDQSFITMVEPMLNRSGPPSGAAGGDLSGTYPSPTVTAIQKISVSNSAPNDGDILQYNASQQKYVPAAASEIVGDGVPAAVWVMDTAPTPSPTNFIGGLREIGAAAEVQKIIISQEVAGLSGDLVIELCKIASDNTITQITQTGLTLISPIHGNLGRIISTSFNVGTSTLDPTDRLGIRVTSAPGTSPQEVTVTVVVSNLKLAPPPPADKKAIVQLIDASVTGTSWSYIGSVHLVPGVLLGANCHFLFGTTTLTDTVTLEIRKFGTTIPITSISATGLLQDKVLAANVVIFEENFYDIFIKAGTSIAVGTIKSLRLVYDPAQRTDVQQAISSSQTGTTAKYLGSIYLPAGTLQVGSSAILGTDTTGATATLELHRFTGGALVGSLSATGASLQKVSPSQGIIIPYPDFYDLYLKASASGVTAMLGGISFVVIG